MKSSLMGNYAGIL